jgi:hypothetical protein
VVEAEDISSGVKLVAETSLTLKSTATPKNNTKQQKIFLFILNASTHC